MSPADLDLSDVRQSWTFDIEMNMPSANTVKRHLWGGRDRTWYSRFKKDLAWMLKLKAQWVPRATGPRKVTVTRLIDKSGKRYDQDNLVGGCKMLLDAMVQQGLLRGDAEKDVTVEYRQEKRSGGGTRIELVDV